jgi:hypothetical protein
MSCALACIIFIIIILLCFIFENIRHVSVKFGISVSKRRYTNFYFSLHQSNVDATSYDT